MVYFHVCRPNYKMIELKDDIILSVSNFHKELDLLVWLKHIQKDIETHINTTDKSDEELLKINDNLHSEAWRVEYNENNDPIAINSRYKYELRDSNVIKTEFG